MKFADNIFKSVVAISSGSEIVKHSFALSNEGTEMRGEVRTIELLHHNPTFRIAVDGQFSGYVERK